MTNIHQYWVYILSNKTRSVLYVGVTNDLYRRYIEHRTETTEGLPRNISAITCSILRSTVVLMMQLPERNKSLEKRKEGRAYSSKQSFKKRFGRRIWMVVTDNKTASNVIPSERSDEESQRPRTIEISHIRSK